MSFSYIIQKRSGDFTGKLAEKEINSRLKRIFGTDANAYWVKRRRKEAVPRKYDAYAKFEAGVHRHISRAEEGDAFVLYTRKHKSQLRVVWTVQPPAAPSGSAPTIKQVWEWLYGTFPQAFSAGVCNCRKISGSSWWSAHASCRAMDVVWNFKGMHLIVSELLSRVKKGQWKQVDAIIFNRRIYKRSNSFRAEAYGGSDPHTGHIHIQLKYDPYATPRCAA